MTIMSHSACLTLVLLCLYNICFSEALKSGFSVEIIHRDSSRSPFYRATETQFQRVTNAVRRSMNRANHFNQISVYSNAVESPVTLLDDGDYLMSYSLGTPPFPVYVLCLILHIPKTYKNLPCSSTTCKSVQGTSCSSDERKICEHTVNYKDGSHSQGDLSVETVTLGSSNDPFVHFPRTVIGCIRNTNVSFDSIGIVGLGGGPVSLVSQLSSSTGKKFSYCLAPISDRSSKLKFGDAAMVSGDGTVSTRIVFKDWKKFYYLTLEAFSAGNNRIEFRSSSSRSSGKGNIIIDSGTAFTVLPDDVYSKLESAVADVVKLERVEDPLKQFSLCYKSTYDKVDVPVITAHFSGADVKLNALNTFIVASHRVVCLAFLSSQSGPIFGNLAQQNFLVGYDLQRKIVSFKPTDCTKQ
ncbi:Aspartic proteinase CDR1 [Glycine soja]|uniref:Aspartic proteinase CDR1 n=1 Tax=Glycine soja TaxID=3848 RepID=A0A445GXJ6_GLYSO|nr:Aspartic proteinase CDR1 [Glycine soja]